MFARFTATLGLVLLFWGATAMAQDHLPNGVAAGPSVEGVSEYRLDNGLRVLLFPDATKPTVTVNLVYGVGSVQENYGETGMAHLLEHLLFKGTPTHEDISGELKRRGVGFNATTGQDRTNYYSSFPSNKETLAWVLGMEADRMVNSRVAQSDLDSEMTVVRNELEAGENNPGGVLGARVRSTAFLWHNYGNSTIGARSDVEGVGIENLRTFYRTWYQPDNATLIVAGRVDTNETLTLVASSFGRLPKPTRALPKAYTIEPAQDGERTVVVRRTGNVRIVMSAYHTPAITHPDNAPLRVLASVLTHTPSGRLHKGLVEPGLAAGISARSDMSKDPGLLSAAMVVPPDGNMEKAETALLALVEAGAPITQGEIDAAKVRFANAYEQYFTNVNAVGMGLSDFQVAGDWRLLFTSRDAIEKVTLDDVNRMARTYLRPSNRTLGRFIPEPTPDRVAIPQAPAAGTVIEGYVGRGAVAAGEAFETSPGNIESRTERFVLGNGLKIAFLPKKTRGSTVMVNATFRFGDERSLRGRTAAGGMAGAMLMRGSLTRSREQIDSEFERLRTTGAVAGGLQSAGIGLVGRRDTIVEALAVAADILRNPAFPESEFEQLKSQSITGIEAGRDDPGARAGRALGEYFNPWPKGHPLEFKTLDEILTQTKAVSSEDARAFHEDFYGTSEGEISVVGDFDPQAVREQLERLFVDWTTKTPYAPINTRYESRPGKSLSIETPDKPNAVLVARMNIPLRVTDPEYPALVVANRIFGGGALKSRLGDRIRQQEGLSYSVGSGVSADDSQSGQDNAGSFSIQAIAAPENMERVVALVREELARFIARGVTEQELSDAISGTLTARDSSRSSDSTVADMLGDQLHFGRTMAFTSALDARIAELSVDDVNAAIAKVLGQGELTIVTAGDFATKTP